MNHRPDIHDRLAASLKAARRSKGLSLDAVAKLSGVSRSMVSQIERGESSPTISTLWNLTQALHVDFAGLWEGRTAPGIEVMRAGAAPLIEGRGNGVRIRILSPPEEAGAHEVYDLDLSAGGALVSDPHGPGCQEQLTVLEGTLLVSSGGESERLGPGDTARYAADRPHEIRAEGGAARAILVVKNG
ncbi:helix-turn-helix domain-containing protein [Solirhodobacter olei]|uniref:helix-turn-helix domain-containing protein n=1 Tax=Solirhodobacter olei TaxID=2493082 RepID=UPI000FDAD225|nr:XRE family transcriptional regulator [Solirhodobacter olei]